MSDFKAEMHQIRFRLGSAPDPAGEAYSSPPEPQLCFRGPTCKAREARGRIKRKGEKGGKGKGRGGRGREGKGKGGEEEFASS